ncbi:MAG: hypothetical protein HQM08_05765 [Candidatus Riflebacteria bacterium]|nr:hypothetical protein [Candidatus Riflebacteria bacterium]
MSEVKTEGLLVSKIVAVSDAEKSELIALEILSGDGKIIPCKEKSKSESKYEGVQKFAIKAPTVLNEAFDYSRPSSFSRGIRLDLGDYSVLLISGTASINEKGATIHQGDFRAQCWRTYRNITTLLESEGATWHDIVRTTCYLPDMNATYKDFNEIRTAFFQWLNLDPLPASTGIQAGLCRDDLLVEIEAIALLKKK